MFTIRIRVSRGLTITGLILAVTNITLGAGPVVGFDPTAAGVRPIDKKQLGGKVFSRFAISAKGSAEVSRYYGTISGVLFQATAQPDASLKSLPVALSYTLKGEHDAVLTVRFGKYKVTSDAPAWIWAIAARFADHSATGAITMFDKPRTVYERRFARRWHARNRVRQRLLWARYHPAVDDTLVGFFLLSADAIVGDPVAMRSLASGLKDFDRYTRDSLKTDRVKSLRSARSLDRIISRAAKPGDCAMLNDVGVKFVYSIAGGKLQISGVPNYRFARKSRAGKYREVTELTASCRTNRSLLKRISPRVYETVDAFSQLVAFFNAVNETKPEKLDAFVKTLKPVLNRIPTIQTPIALPYRTR